MPVFMYNIERNGKILKGEIKAKNIQIARLRLKARKIDPIYIKEKPLVPFFSGGGKVNSKTILFFTRQLAFLLNSGVSLIQSLEMCVSTSDNEYFKSVLRSILKQLEAGKSLSQCLRSRPDVFSGFYVNMVVCAEETGLLDQVLSDLANYMEKAHAIQTRVKSAMMYPVIVLIISFSIITGIIIFVVPQFESLYAGSKEGLPVLTQAFVNLSNLLRSNPLPLVATLIGIPVFLYQYRKTESGKRNINAFVKMLPLFKNIQYQAALVRFTRSFYSLLKSGVNFLEALNVAHDIAEHETIQRGVSTARDHVTKGKSFAKGLEVSKSFPPLVYHMSKIGEESGKMENTFEKLTTYYETQLEALIAGLIKMIEPLLIVVLGGIIGVMILALYLPVFNMGSVVN